MKLYSYVVEHVCGLAPSVSGAYCTLAKCKYKKDPNGRRNIVELADIGDWVVGTGGSNRECSAGGHGKIVYAMKVTEKMLLSSYYADDRFASHLDHHPDNLDRPDRWVLISSSYYYFGKNGIEMGDVPIVNLNHALEKKGPGFRSDFGEMFIHDFSSWLQQQNDHDNKQNICAKFRECNPRVTSESKQPMIIKWHGAVE